MKKIYDFFKINRLIILTTILWLLIIVFININSTIQLENDYLNVIIRVMLLILVLIIPIIIGIILSLKATSAKKRAISVILTIILVIIIFFPAGFLIMDLSFLIGNGKDNANEQIQLIRLEDSNIAVYLTNCGATCDFGISVEQQKPFFGFLKRVRSIRYWYHASELTLEKSGKNQVRVVSYRIYGSTSLDNPKVGEVWNLQW